jgi:hypothetical protein
MTKPTGDETRRRARRQRRAGHVPVPHSLGSSEVQASGAGGANPFKAVGGSDDPHFNAVLMRQLLGIVWVPAGDPNYGTQHRLGAATTANLTNGSELTRSPQGSARRATQALWPPSSPRRCGGAELPALQVGQKVITRMMAAVLPTFFTSSG